jgi:hypothetical protein
VRAGTASDARPLGERTDEEERGVHAVLRETVGDTSAALLDDLDPG